MKNTFFSKTLLVIFLFGGLSANAQVRVKTNNSRGSKKAVVKSNRTNNRGVRVKTNNRRGNKKVVVKSNRTNNHSRGAVRAKTHRNRVVVKKPNRPHVIINRPNYNRAGYIWAQGYWEWNAFYGQYTWQQARWIKIKRNHYWVPGFWEITVGGFFWVQGYWALEY